MKLHACEFARLYSHADGRVRVGQPGGHLQPRAPAPGTCLHKQREAG